MAESKRWEGLFCFCFVVFCFFVCGGGVCCLIPNFWELFSLSLDIFSGRGRGLPDSKNDEVLFSALDISQGK